jgi:hypothetical protein
MKSLPGSTSTAVQSRSCRPLVSARKKTISHWSGSVSWNSSTRIRSYESLKCLRTSLLSRRRSLDLVRRSWKSRTPCRDFSASYARTNPSIHSRISTAALCDATVRSSSCSALRAAARSRRASSAPSSQFFLLPVRPRRSPRPVCRTGRRRGRPGRTGRGSPKRRPARTRSRPPGDPR